MAPKGVSSHRIAAGLDFLETASEGAVFRFDKIPIPAGFFANNSQAFTQTVKFRGRPLPRSYFNGSDITHVDTIVQRKEPVELRPPYPCSHVIPIELVALALESMEPIEVQVGKRAELWDVQVELSGSRRSEGTMTISKTDRKGGSFDSQFAVFPVFRFIRRCDGKERVLDIGTLRLPSEIIEMITLRSTKSPWLHTAPGTLRLKGLNDNFIAGAPALISENSEACVHTTSEAPDCDVIIIAQSRCLCLGKTRPFTGRGSPDPFSGSYTWTITQGASRASIVGGANQRHVTVEGTSTSGAANDIRLQVEYQSPGGGVCSASIGLTTINAELILRASDTISFENGADQDTTVGHPRLGPVTPGNPPGCMGFFKNVEIRAGISPGDLSIPCKDKFKFRRIVVRGRSGLLFPDGTWDADDIDCPVGPCPDDSLANRQDVMPAPSTGTVSLIFDIDSPGFRVTAGLACPGGDGQVGINWAHFDEWLEVDGQECGNHILWHANTRVRCESGTWVEVNSSVGLGHPDPGYTIPSQFVGFSLPEAAKLLTSPSGEDRVKAHNVIKYIYASDRLSTHEGQELVHDLLRIENEHAEQKELASPLRLAIQLLGLLKVEDAIPIFMENLLTEFQRPVSGRFPTAASYALVNLGPAAIPAIIHKASTASDEEWRVLEDILKAIEDQQLVQRPVCRALDSDLSNVAEGRLDRYLSGQR